MTKNPILNAALAALYVGGVSSIMYFGQPLVDPVDNVLMPIAMLSLFSLSAAIMACIFFYKPVMMYLDGQKVAAAKLVVHTIASFAVITAIFLATLFISPLFY